MLEGLPSYPLSIKARKSRERTKEWENKGLRFPLATGIFAWRGREGKWLKGGGKKGAGGSADRKYGTHRSRLLQKIQIVWVKVKVEREGL